MADCTLEQAPCSYRGVTDYDWKYSFFRKLCELLGWQGAIQDNTSVAAFGTIAVVPSYAQVTSVASVRQVTVPAGALSIQAVIDEEYASTYAITIVQSGGNVTLPEGTDFDLPFVSPIYKADVNGQDVTRGHGTYPQTVLQYPANSKGFITALYRETAQPITVTTI